MFSGAGARWAALHVAGGWQGLTAPGMARYDLRIEPELKSRAPPVIGQITNHVAPTETMGDLPVSLRAGNLVVAETLSNRFGDSKMEYDNSHGSSLWHPPSGFKLIQVPLKNLRQINRPLKSRAPELKR